MTFGYEYNFNRSRGADEIHISPDEFDIGHEGENPTLAKRIENEWPDKLFKVVCNESICTVSFEVELTGTEETMLSGLIATHKSVDDWPP